MSYFDLLRAPDHVVAVTDDRRIALSDHAGNWADGDVAVTTDLRDDGLAVGIAAGTTLLQRVILRWRCDVPDGLRFLGDHWERAYGDLEWRCLAAQRVMPWYFLAFDGELTHGYGVATQPGAFCCWTVDDAGVNLLLDVRSGGVGVDLGGRKLAAAVVRTRRGQPGDCPQAAATEFCKLLCPSPRLADHPVYGSNNWYYAYGKSSHEQILEDTKLLVSYAPTGDNRPYMVIDAGWQGNASGVQEGSCCGGPWDRSNKQFPDMQRLAAEMAALGVRPGIWLRPLASAGDEEDSVLLPVERATDDSAKNKTLDPSIPDILDRIEADFARMRTWGYRIIKHDWTTCDILGRWGFQMGMTMTNPGWRFYDRSKTTAEVIIALFRAIRRGAGDSLIIGCNTVGHLGAGLFEVQRTGDDTSGHDWERTRRMGVNTLAFRMPQHNTFFAHDADCVGLTTQVAWELNRQWLDLLARSGTPLFVSPDPKAVETEQAKALRAAHAAASTALPPAQPLDWMDNTCPRRWVLCGEETTFEWYPDAGVNPSAWTSPGQF